MFELSQNILLITKSSYTNLNSKLKICYHHRYQIPYQNMATPMDIEYDIDWAFETDESECEDLEPSHIKGK